MANKRRDLPFLLKRSILSANLRCSYSANQKFENSLLLFLKRTCIHSSLLKSAFLAEYTMFSRDVTCNFPLKKNGIEWSILIFWTNAVYCWNQEPSAISISIKRWRETMGKYRKSDLIRSIRYTQRILPFSLFTSKKKNPKFPSKYYKRWNFISLYRIHHNIERKNRFIKPYLKDFRTNVLKLNEEVKKSKWKPHKINIVEIVNYLNFAKNTKWAIKIISFAGRI